MIFVYAQSIPQCTSCGVAGHLCEMDAIVCSKWQTLAGRIGVPLYRLGDFY